MGGNRPVRFRLLRRATRHSDRPGLADSGTAAVAEQGWTPAVRSVATIQPFLNILMPIGAKFGVGDRYDAFTRKCR